MSRAAIPAAARRAAPAWALAWLLALPLAVQADEGRGSLAERDAGLIDQALQALPSQRPGTVDLYVVGFAGDGMEDVFRNEVAYLPELARQRLRARGVMTLVNHLDGVLDHPAPLATYENLERTLDGIGKRIDPKEDVLLLYLTMHGTPDHELVLNFPPFVEDTLLPEDLRTLLDESGIVNRVVVVSACYSGGFIAPLSGPDTLVIAAARADRTSFGCGAASTVTWFGRAFLVDGLNDTPDFSGAFLEAREQIEQWERRERIEASFPQLSQGERIGVRLREREVGLDPGARVAYPYPIEEPGSPARHPAPRNKPRASGKTR